MTRPGLAQVTKRGMLCLLSNSIGRKNGLFGQPLMVMTGNIDDRVRHIRRYHISVNETHPIIIKG